MKVGIFGDSFAHKCIQNKTPSWTDIIARKYTIRNYSYPGSNLFYSMDLFLKNHNEYDKIVFVVTNPGRILLPNSSDFKDKNGITDLKPSVVSNYDNAVFLKEMYKDDPVHSKRLEATMDFFLYVQNTDFEKYVHLLMVEEITRIRPDAVVVPAFNVSTNYKGTSMHQIQIKENNAWNYNPELAEINDIRHSHMTAENNAIFASEVEEWLNGEPVHINLYKYVKPSPESMDFYIKKL